MRTLLLAPLILLAGCGGEPENIQAKSENMSRMLEQRAAEITAEADNGAAASAAPLENEAEALLDRLDSNAADNMIETNAR